MKQHRRNVKKVVTNFLLLYYDPFTSETAIEQESVYDLILRVACLLDCEK